jgi:quercetin dioxygenase-like cupin family protein
VSRPQGTVLLAELAPGAETGKHEHPGDEMAYVLGGSVTVEVDGQAPVTFKAGDAFYQPMGQPHTVKNASTTAPAKVLMVLVEKGMRKRKGERLRPVEPGQPSPPLTPRTP